MKNKLVSFGKILDKTEITPLPPIDINGTIWSSFPQYKSSLPFTRLIVSTALEISPFASFIAQTFLWSASAK